MNTARGIAIVAIALLATTAIAKWSSGPAQAQGQDTALRATCTVIGSANGPIVELRVENAGSTPTSYVLVAVLSSADESIRSETLSGRVQPGKMDVRVVRLPSSVDYRATCVVEAAADTKAPEARPSVTAAKPRPRRVPHSGWHPGQTTAGLVLGQVGGGATGVVGGLGGLVIMAFTGSCQGDRCLIAATVGAVGGYSLGVGLGTAVGWNTGSVKTEDSSAIIGALAGGLIGGGLLGWTQYTKRYRLPGLVSVLVLPSIGSTVGAYLSHYDVVVPTNIFGPIVSVQGSQLSLRVPIPLRVPGRPGGRENTTLMPVVGGTF